MKKLRVLVTADRVARAAAYMADVMRSNTVTSTRNYTGLEVPARYLIGEIGEIAFANLLWQQGTPFQRTNTRNGQSDVGDFHVGGRVLDIKNSDHPRARFLMMPASQFQRRHCDVYVAATTEMRKSGEATVIFHGAIERADFERRSIQCDMKVPTMKLDLKELPISTSTLLNQLAAAEVSDA